MGFRSRTPAASRKPSSTGNPQTEVCATKSKRHALVALRACRMKTLAMEIAYLTLAKMMAKVYSAIDSISTSASSSANLMGAAAPGLRARPSQAEDVARA